MPGRPRRTRVLVGLVVFIVIALYYSKGGDFGGYGDFVADRIGGGAVLRHGDQDTSDYKPELYQPDHPDQRPILEPPTPQETTSTTPVEAAIPKQTTTTTADETTSETTQTTTTSTEPPLVVQKPPYYEPDKNEKLPYELGEGKHELGESPTVKSTTYWEPHTENYPVKTTIQLPTAKPSPIPRIQYNGKLPADTERLAAVRRQVSHAWGGYVEKAFGADEVLPVSGGKKNPFNGWGATLVDSLDTLWMLGLKQEFEEAVKAVSKIEFTTSKRHDIPLFETTIRYLGGLLGAHDVSDGKYPILLDKAVELAEVLFGAFDTPNRMPVTYYPWQPEYARNKHRASSRVVMAELGSLSVEFTRLAQLTGEPKYYDAIARITDAFEEWQGKTSLPGMWPISVDASGCNNSIPRPVARPKTIKASDGSTLMKGAGVQAQGSLNGLKSDDLWGNGIRPPKKADSLWDDEVHSSPKETSGGIETSDSTGNVPLSLDDAKKVAAGHLNGKRAPVQVQPDDDDDEEDLCVPQGLTSGSYYGSETYTLGGQSDSTYEYLPKQFLLLGGLVEQYRTMYEEHAETAIENLMFRPMTKEGYDLLVAGNSKVSVNRTTGAFDKVHEPHGEHLTCFAGGMFAMAGKVFNRPGDVEVGRKLTHGCVWSYNSTVTGIMPEGFDLFPCEDRNHCPYNKTAYYQALDPYWESRPPFAPAPAPKTPTPLLSEPEDASTLLFGNDVASIKDTESPAALGAPGDSLKATGDHLRAPGDALGAPKDTTYKAAFDKRQLDDGWDDFQLVEPTKTVDDEFDSPINPIPPKAHADQGSFLDEVPARKPVPASKAHRPTNNYEYTPPPPLTHAEYVEKTISEQGIPDGFTRIQAAGYILRPEAIESVFYMYRITGEQYWRDAGWKMFESVASLSRAPYGHSAIDDVTKPDPNLRDSMESFWLAETVKYFYLLFDDGDTWSLDDYVLNTEAHFFKRPRGGFLH